MCWLDNSAACRPLGPVRLMRKSGSCWCVGLTITSTLSVHSPLSALVLLACQPGTVVVGVGLLLQTARSAFCPRFQQSPWPPLSGGESYVRRCNARQIKSVCMTTCIRCSLLERRGIHGALSPALQNETRQPQQEFLGHEPSPRERRRSRGGGPTTCSAPSSMVQIDKTTG